MSPNRKFRLRSRAAFAFCHLLILSRVPVRAAQDKPNKGDNEEKTLFLVARTELRDPIFKESVVLMFPSSVGVGEGLIVGLIVNKPARVELSEIFPDDPALKNRPETAYFGGPVDPRAPGKNARLAPVYGALPVGGGATPKRDGYGSVV